jgi:hypothetical protein
MVAIRVASQAARLLLEREIFMLKEVPLIAPAKAGGK